MYDVQADHRVDIVSDDVMEVTDWHSGETLVTAVRTTGVWTIHAPGTAERITHSRPDAVTAMIDAALESLPGTGYSTLVPHQIAEMD